MNVRHPPGESVGLIFDWAARLDRRRRLALWLLVALVLHAGAILLLGHQPLKSVNRQPGEETLFVVSSADLGALEAIVNASDPALFAPGQVRDGLLDLPPHPTYRPSFDTMDFKPLPLPKVDARVLPAVDSRLMDFVKSRAKDKNPGSRSPAALPTKTQIRFSASLEPRASQVAFPRVTALKPDGDFLPSEFLVAINRDGGVHHVFPRSTTRLSDQATAALQDLLLAKFDVSDSADALTWGTVTIHWGAGEGIAP
jgi:hypothetical protein